MSSTGRLNSSGMVGVTPAKKNLSIVEWHLFGEQAGPVTEANMKWVLRGIILGNKMTQNFAIIASSDTDETVYKSGDKLADGTIVMGIQPDKVLLIHEGTIETLYLPGTEDHKQNSLLDSNEATTTGNESE